VKSESGASRASSVRFALDANCLVAMLADWHPRHRATVAGYERRLAAGQRPVVAGHALLECFSVLTRLPGPVRVSPETAEGALSAVLGDGVETVGLAPDDYWRILRTVSRSGRGGGLVYDAAIAWASFRAGATALLTWNVKDMSAVAPAGLQVAEP
jgi:predicted nucleic acid-binding protein